MNAGEVRGKTSVALSSLLNRAATDYEEQAVSAKACVERYDLLREAYEELAQVLIELAQIKREVARLDDEKPKYDWSDYQALFKRREQLQAQINELVKAGGCSKR